MHRFETGICCVTAPNPSPLTYRGTNTFIIGTSHVAIVDPGPIIDSHFSALLAAIDGRPVDAVIVTHSHLDHSPMARPLADRVGAPVIAFGPSDAGRSAVMRSIVDDIGGGEGVDADFEPDQTVGHLDVVCGMTVLHTPGHMGNHICLEKGDILLCGDHIMGWSTSLVSPPDGDLTDFMASCAMLLDRPSRRYFPAHGDPIDRPHDRVREIMAHRKSREAQILDALKNGTNTAAALVQAIYHDIDPKLWPAAERNIIAHLIDLVGQNRVRPVSDMSVSGLFELC
ncbi:hypothetical protein BVC71_14870 [Marivivens niveibacter]|uniref:Metallo-beta-lactamase domain-containing protein n=1 Tax=Marivivens niveibacter TaxID=1930667 RepID=A0A251WVQ3_9RHOB|nr:MBL fold metallo-hydrolase [Marivivens niveibacter]OUD08235.1 hypothetical protein BVC71_14870 [Marivivens niveibacter]